MQYDSRQQAWYISGKSVFKSHCSGHSFIVGKAYLQVCPEAVIFDTHVDACVTPDQARRPDCKANKFLGFECPTYKPEE